MANEKTLKSRPSHELQVYNVLLWHIYVSAISISISIRFPPFAFTFASAVRFSPEKGVGDAELCRIYVLSAPAKCMPKCRLSLKTYIYTHVRVCVWMCVCVCGCG